MIQTHQVLLYLIAAELFFKHKTFIRGSYDFIVPSLGTLDSTGTLLR